MTAFSNGNSASTIAVEGAGYGRSGIDAEAGHNFDLSRTAALSAGYEGRFRTGSNSHGVSAGFRVSLGSPAVAPPMMEAAPPPPPPPPPPPESAAERPNS